MPETPRYCSACGERLSPGDQFCSACGTAVRESDDSDFSVDTDFDIDTGFDTDSPAGSGSGVGSAADTGSSGSHDSRSSGSGSTASDVSPEDRAWLRQRVEDMRVEGWDVTHESDDRAVLVNKTLGSPLVHLLLFFPTSGVGNVLYAWYKWTRGAPKREVYADGTERDFNQSSIGTVLTWVVVAGVLGFNGLIATFALLLNATFVASLFVLLSLLVVGAGVGLTRDVDTESPTTFGRAQTVETESVRTPPESCASCGSRVIKGERRTFSDKLYLAGLPVRTYDEGENTYCADCVVGSGDPSGPDDLEAELARLRSEGSSRGHGGAHNHGGGHDDAHSHGGSHDDAHSHESHTHGSETESDRSVERH